MSLLCVGTGGPTTIQLRPGEVATEIRSVLTGDQMSQLGIATAPARDALIALYAPIADAALWVDDDGRPNSRAHDALELLERAPGHGLDPADYRASELGLLMTALTRRASRACDIARFDVGMSGGVLRYFHDVHHGRLDPREMGFRMSAPRDDLDLVRTLRSSLTENRLQEAAENLAPRLAQYALLRDALATYRALLAPDVAPPLPHFAGVLHPGDRFRDTLSLYQRLVAFGDMPSTAPPPHQAYDGVLVAGVKRFQTRHGLTADGVMGERTQAAMRVPLAWRVRQIELALERLRWLPPPGDGPMVLLNIPMFRLWAFDSIRTASTPALSMNVIVGRALDQQTPVFVRDMRYVILRPYWNVPTSILRNEILPIVARDPGYLEREGFEIVRGAGDAVDIVPVTPESLRRLAHGGLWLRQRPGPKNALGSIKFVFPNDDDVYMHGTPARGLFAQARRDFSHGCVRVEDPIGLATWALANQDDWSRDRIVAAADGTETRRVNLERPIQVVIFYTTAAVLPDDGAVHFAVDLYGHDAKLDRALKARP